MLNLRNLQVLGIQPSDNRDATLCLHYSARASALLPLRNTHYYTAPSTRACQCLAASLSLGRCRPCHSSLSSAWEPSRDRSSPRAKQQWSTHNALRCYFENGPGQTGHLHVLQIFILKTLYLETISSHMNTLKWLS